MMRPQTRFSWLARLWRFAAIAAVACCALPLALAAAGEPPPITAPPITSPPITALAWGPDGDSVVVGSQLGLRLLRWPDLREIATHSAGPSMILSLEFREERLLVAGGEPGETGYLALSGIELDADGVAGGLLRPLQISNQFTDYVYSARWSPDGRRIAAASFDGTAAVWEILQKFAGEEHRETLRFDGHSGGVTGVAWLAADQIASSSRDATIRVWDPSDGELIRTLNHHTHQVMGLAIAPDHSGLPLMSSIGDDRTIRFWQPTIGRMVRFARLSDERPLCHDWTAEARSVVVGTTAGRIVEIDAATAEVVRTEHLNGGWITAIAIATDGTLLCGTSDGELKILPPLSP